MSTGLGMAAMNFSWLEDGLIAGCRGPRTDADLAFLASIGIRALVRLAAEEESGLTTIDVARNRIRDCYEPVPDWTAPLQEQIDRIMVFLQEAVSAKEPVAVSCGAGYGRTGTVLACYIVSCGAQPEDAIRKLIAARPCSDEILRVPGQREAVFQFHRRCQNREL